MSSNPTTSKKRKLTEPKFYGVRAGHTIGVFEEWSDCKAQITGYKGAAFKSFPTRADAQAFVEGRDVTASTAEGSKTDRFYGVAVGSVPGVYTDWPTAQKQILGVKGPKYRKFSTREEATEFVRSHGKDASQLTNLDDAINVIRPISTNSNEEFEEPPHKSRKLDTTSAKPITNVFQSRSSAASSKALRIYTDGSCLSNGNNGASAGAGVFFGIGDERNISEPLPGPRQTNQRAELHAILRTLEVVPQTLPVQIVTDSKYSIDCATKWYVSWEKNGWKNAKREDVENQDLIKGVLARIRERQRLGCATDFLWVKGHSSDPGNEAADMLAVAGARRGL